MNAIEPPDRLAGLIADFERSNLGELRLAGPDFTLHLRKGRRPRWTVQSSDERGTVGQ